MSLLSSLPAAECRKHLAVFSAATPVGALVSYGVLALMGGAGGDWTGIALLVSVSIFSPSFSYVSLNSCLLPSREVPFYM